MPERLEPDRRVLIFAPVGRDAPAMAELILRTHSLSPFVCASFEDLMTGIRSGAAVVLVAEEGLFGKDVRELVSWVNEQPPWSDLPFVVLTSHQQQQMVADWRTKLIADLRKVTL